MEKYTYYTQGPWLAPEENDAVAAAYYAAVDAGDRRILLEWSWSGGRDILHAVDARGRSWHSYNGQRRQIP